MARARWISLFAGVLIGLLLLSPAGAHFKPTLKHVRNHMKRTFYTEAEADQRYLRRGPIRIAHAGPWFGTLMGQSDVAVVEPALPAQYLTHANDSSTTPYYAYTHIPTPLEMGGVEYRFKAVEVCFFSQDAADLIVRTEAREVRHDIVFGRLLAQEFEDHSSGSLTPTCYSLEAPTPVEIDGALALVVGVDPDGDAAPESVGITSATATWVP